MSGYFFEAIHVSLQESIAYVFGHIAASDVKVAVDTYQWP